MIDMLDHSSSVTASMPALLILTVFGFVGAFRTRLLGTGRAAALRAPLLGALGAIGFVTTIAFVAQRYLGDFVPVLVLGGLVGAYVLAARPQAAATRGRRFAWRAGLVVLAVLAVGSIWVNGALTLSYQRLYNPNPDTLRVDMLRFQYDLADAVGFGTPQVDLAHGHGPGSPAPAGTVRIVGGCDAMYWSDGEAWQLVEGAPGGGVRELRLAPPPADGRWHPVMSWGGATSSWAIGAQRHGDDVRIARGIAGADGRIVFRGWTDVAWAGDRAREAQVATITPRHELRVQVDGQDVLVDPLRGTAPVQPRVGTAHVPGVAATYGSTVTELPARVSLCETLLARL